MRTTKKNIYAKYGIIYDPKTSHILTPYGWRCELLKVGNDKTGKTVKTWSMHTTTCAVRCADCYGNSGHYKRASVQNSLTLNTNLARYNLDFLERAIMAQLETLKAGAEIRIHALGDFFSDDYADMWVRIVKAFPHFKFWTYTKVKKYETLFDGFANANIVKSIVNGKFNFGHCAHVMGLYEELKEAGASVHICKCGVDDSQHCAGCAKCSINEFVLFLEHSTAYNAKKDPLYGEFCELVNGQK